MIDKTFYVPGPWEICRNPVNSAWYAGITIGAADPKDGRRICDLTPLAPDEMREANGALICAAPELLAALKGIVDLKVQVICESAAGKAALEAALNNAYAVIAKAEGES